MPALLELKMGYYIVAAQLREDSILCFDPDETEPKLIKINDFHTYFTGRALLAVDRKYLNREVAFGLKWF